MGDNDEITKWHTATPPRILGQGTFGRVLEAIDDTSGEIIAVKETTRSRASRSKSIQALQQEMSMLRLLCHQNIVEYRGVQTAKSSESDKSGDEVLLFLMEYCPNGSISDVLEEFGALGDDVTRKYTSQILCGLDYLHRLCVVHRDIKCANCLLSVGGVVKLADFGSSKHLADCGNSIQGTALYMAPEVIRGGRTGRQADIWAVGCCVVEMLGNSMPLEGKFSNDFALMYRISKTKVSPKAPEDIAPDAKDFVEQCFTIVPENRPSAFHLFSNHPYVVNMYPDTLSTPYTPMADHAKPYLDRYDSGKWSDGSDNQGLELGASARSHNDRLKREVSKVSWSRANKDMTKDSSMDDMSNGSSSETRRLGDALIQPKQATVDRPGGEPTSTVETKIVNLHFQDDNHETWKEVNNPDEKKKNGEPLMETKPIVGRAMEGNIGRLQTRTGFLFNRFEDEEVEKDYLVYFKRRALSFMSERRALVPCLVFGMYLLTFLFRTNVSKAESIAITLKIISWTMLAAFQVLPLIDGEDTFNKFSSIVFLYKCVSLITAWDHNLFYHAFEIAVVSGLSGYFSQVRHHTICHDVSCLCMSRHPRPKPQNSALQMIYRMRDTCKAWQYTFLLVLCQDLQIDHPNSPAPFGSCGTISCGSSSTCASLAPTLLTTSPWTPLFCAIRNSRIELHHQIRQCMGRALISSRPRKCRPSVMLCMTTWCRGTRRSCGFTLRLRSCRSSRCFRCTTRRA